MKQKHRALSRLNEAINTTTQSNHPDEQCSKKYRSVIYIRHLSEKVNSVIKSTAKELKIAPKPNRQLKSTIHTNTKQKPKPEDTINCVHKIPCNGTEGEPCDECYIGQTINRLKDRLRTHSWDIRDGEYANTNTQNIQYS